MKKSDVDADLSSPIPLGPSSNGEVPPEPRTRRHDLAEELFRRIVDEKSKRLGMTRRKFIDSSCGTLAGLWVSWQVASCSRDSEGMGVPGTGQDAGYDVPRDISAQDAAAIDREVGSHNVPSDALEDQARADAMLAGDEFIFDVQVHNRVPNPPWNASLCNDGPNKGAVCPSEWLRQIFVASDTSVACLSGYPTNTPSIEVRDSLKRLIDMVQGSPRLLIHANVFPENGAPEFAAMQTTAAMYPVAAWKTYPERGGTPLNQRTEFFAAARQASVKIVAAHRGLGGGPGYNDPYSPRDVVAAAAAPENQDFTFLVYHSGIDNGIREVRPFNAMNPSGIDRLIMALDEFKIGQEGKVNNVYAELGSTWNRVMRDRLEATHTIGKLLRYLGPDRILWGTDSMNDGNPSAQIAAFRVFEMDAVVQAMYGYPALTPEVKRKILGLNAARVYDIDPSVVRRKLRDDDISQLQFAWRQDRRSVPMSPHRFHGPRTWREYLAFRRWSGEEA
jgi:uncharacterized protein